MRVANQSDALFWLMALDNPTASGMQSPHVRPQTVRDCIIFAKGAAISRRVGATGSLLFRRALVGLRAALRGNDCRHEGHRQKAQITFHDDHRPTLAFENSKSRAEQ